MASTAGWALGAGPSSYSVAENGSVLSKLYFVSDRAGRALEILGIFLTKKGDERPLCTRFLDINGLK